MTSLKQLRYFATVVELGSITAAAERLHVAQPSLGVQVKLLEDNMKVALLARHSRGVSPTEAGRILYKKAIEILKEVDALPDHVRQAAPGTIRTISLGLPGSVTRLLSDDILSDTAPIMPQIRIRLVEERSLALKKALDRREIDVILSYERPSDTRLSVTAILEEELLFVAAPTFSRSAAPISTAEVLRSPLVLSGLDGTVHNAVSAQASRLNTSLEPAFSVHSASALKRIVMQGKATSVLPMGQVLEEMAAGSLSCRRIEGQPLYRTLYFARMRDTAAADGADIDTLLEKLSVLLRGKLGNLAHPVGQLSARSGEDA